MSPFSPLFPVSPCKPTGPIMPCLPLFPGDPIIPWSPLFPVLPFCPLRPRAPLCPLSPGRPGGPGRPDEHVTTFDWQRSILASDKSLFIMSIVSAVCLASVEFLVESSWRLRLLRLEEEPFGEEKKYIVEWKGSKDYNTQSIYNDLNFVLKVTSFYCPRCHYHRRRA